jgi:hypothetical protein
MYSTVNRFFLSIFHIRSGLSRVANSQLRLLRLCRLARPSNRSIKLYQTTRHNIDNHFSENHKIISINIMFLDIIHRPVYIFTYSGLAWLIIMGSGLYVWIYWHFFTITINYNSSQSMTVYGSLHSLLDYECLLFHCDERRTINHCSHIELLLNAVWRISRDWYLLDWTTIGPNVDHHLEQFLCYSVLSVAAETSEPLPSKLASASAAIPAFRQCLPSHCPAMDYSVIISKKKSYVYFKTQRFGDWILSPSSGKTYSVGPNR